MQLNEYKDLLDLFIPAGFGPDEEEYDYYIPDDFQTVQDQLPDYVDMKWGISQFVIIKNDWDKVAKIGFNGWWVWDNSRDEISFRNYETNYADKAYRLYKEAQLMDIAPMFAGMEVLGRTGDSTVYLQEKIKCDFLNSYTEVKSATEDSRDYVREQRTIGRSIWRMFDRDWLAQAVDFYGKELVEDTLAFLQEHHIYDFNEGNYGYREDGSPVIIDFSDFNEVA